MIVSVVRKALLGNITFSASGGFPALFLEECAARGAVLENVERGDEFVRANVRERDRLPVCAAAEKAGMAFRIETHTGLPYLLFRYRSRVGIPVGLLLAALIVWYLSGTLWQITVTGNVKLSAIEILDAMEEIGVRRGVRIKDVDVKDTVRQAQNLLPGLSWIAVNIKGCKAEVEVREIVAGVKPHSGRAYANIVAARDGVIVRADVLAGVGQPKVGEAVVKGDLLVSGVIGMKNGFFRFTEARAIIEAMTVTRLSVTEKSRFTIDQPLKERELCGLRFFGISVPLGISFKSGEHETVEYDLKSRKTVFPIGFTRDKAVVYESAETSLDEEQTALLSFAAFCDSAYQRYRDADVTEIEIAISVSPEGCETTARFRCIEDIARSVPFEVQKNRSQ